ncbi:MAG: FAD-dependent oxidoreductase [Candidatus Competibacteraceae bacterium]
MRVVVVGGGYAGLAAIISLRRRMAETEIHLLDPGSHHLKRTCLQKTLHTPLGDQQIPFSALAKRFDFTHHRVEMVCGPDELRAWQDQLSIPLRNGLLDFDYLILATGARPAYSGNSNEGVYDLNAFCHGEGQKILTDYLTHPAKGTKVISVVGAGATGLQFLFELHHWIKKTAAPYRLRLIDRAETLLAHLPGRFHRYVSNRLHAADIAYLPATHYLGQTNGRVHIKALQSSQESGYPQV